MVDGFLGERQDTEVAVTFFEQALDDTGVCLHLVTTGSFGLVSCGLHIAK